MSRALGPRTGPMDGAGPAWTILIACWALLGAVAVMWGAARLAAAVAGGRVEPFGTGFVADLVHGRTGAAWPGVPGSAVAGVLGLIAAVITGGAAAGMWWWRRGRAPVTDPVAALSTQARTAVMTRDAVAERVAELRPSLTGRDPRRLADRDIGVALGSRALPGRDRHGPGMFASWEDTLLAFMAPRSGKTTALAVPQVLAAPGPVLATSIKADLWAATAQLRGEAGPVWLFDPQHITHQGQTWWWDLLAGLVTVEDAYRVAGHFVLTVDDGQRRDLWGPAAQELLTALLLAAAVRGGTLHDVARWLNEPAVPTPIEVLTGAGYEAMAASLRGTQNGAVETRDGIYQTARTAARCLTDPVIMAWVTPPDADLPSFDPASFVGSNGTLYLLSKSKSAAAPLIAALTDTVMRAAELLAEAAGGRLDPPLPVILDEAANICRIADLPDLYSHLGSRGIVPVTVLQSYEQGITVWGEAGMAALWGAATRKLIGAGVDSPRLTRDLATLIGQHDVPVRSITYADGRASEQVSLRRQDILEPADIRALRAGTAVVLATGVRPVLIDLLPYYTGPDAARINAAFRAATGTIRDAARQAAEHTGSPDREGLEVSP